MHVFPPHMPKAVIAQNGHRDWLQGASTNNRNNSAGKALGGTADVCNSFTSTKINMEVRSY